MTAANQAFEPTTIGQFRFFTETHKISAKNRESIILWVMEYSDYILALEKKNTPGMACENKPWQIPFRKEFKLDTPLTEIDRFCANFAVNSAFRNSELVDFFGYDIYKANN